MRISQIGLLSLLFWSFNTSSQDHPPIESLTAQELLDLTWEYRNTDASKAKDYGLAAIAAAKQENDSTLLANAYSFAGVAYRNLGEYIKAFSLYIEGWEISKRINDEELLSYAYLNLANLSLYLKKPDQAKKYLESMQDIMMKLGDKNIVGYYHLYLGRALLNLGDYDEAMIQLISSLKTRQEMGKTSGVSVAKKYLGDLYLMSKKHEVAQVYYQEAMDIMDKDKDKDLYSSALNGMAQTHIHFENYNKAKDAALLSLNLGNQVGSLLRQREAYETLAEIEKINGNFLNVEAYLNKVIELNQGLYNEERRLQSELFDYEISLKEAAFDKEKQRLKFEEEKRIYTYTATVVILFLLVSTVLGVRIYLQQKRLALERLNLQKSRDLNAVLEQKVSARTKELKDANDKLKKVSQYKQEFTQMLAHDLKNPLSVILGYSDLVNPRTFGSQIKLSGQNMLGLIMNMIDIQKFEEAKMKLNRVSVSFHDLYQNAKNEVTPLAEMKNISIDYISKEDFVVEVDKELILRVLINLLSNSIKYTEKGGYVTVNTFESTKNGRIGIKIEDNGIGLKNEQIEHLFVKYWQANPQGNGRIKSSGIGLTFCKMAIEAHNGEIDAERDRLVGAAFCFDLAYIKTQKLAS